MAKPWRPLLDDVDRLSRGERAKIRGTGCHDIPHRLNADERAVYEAAKKKGFLAVRGHGYRRERRGNPLPNTFRQWADARGLPCVVIEQDQVGDSGVDKLVVDVATLRLLGAQATEAEALIDQVAREVGVRRLSGDDRPADAVPFNIIPYDLSDVQLAVKAAASFAAALAQAASAYGAGRGKYGMDDEGGHHYGHDDGALMAAAAHDEQSVAGTDHAGGSSTISSSSSSSSGDEASGLVRGDTASGASSSSDSGISISISSSRGSSHRGSSKPGRPTQLNELQAAVADAAAAVRQLKAEGKTKQDPVLQANIQALLRLKAQLQQAEAVARPGAIATVVRAAALEGLFQAASSTGGAAAGGGSAGAVTAAAAAAAAAATSAAAAASGRTRMWVAASSSTVAVSSSSSSSQGDSAAAVATTVATAVGAAQGAHAAGAGATVGPGQQEPPSGKLLRLHPYYKLAIWQIPSSPLFFEADRTTAKHFAAVVVERLREYMRAAK